MAPTAANCTDAADCSHNGACSDDGSSCVCAPGWAGTHCAAVKWARDARRAFDDPLWTWGGSAIRGPDGLVHMFASELTNDCGILHYCSNSRVVHLTASDPLGPYVRRAVALEPRAPPLWDSGAVHGPTVHALPQGGYALYYMGTQLTWNGTHPSCTDTVDPNTGNRSTRRIGVATSASLCGPWTRRDAPVLGPSKAAWDWLDVSNPTPIVFANGTTLMLYKGRGGVQAMGVARADRFDGPFERLRPSSPILMAGSEDTWGWVASDGVLHTLSHNGNGRASAGAHAYSLDGVDWVQARDYAYNGTVAWHDGTTTVLARRERPQALLRGGGAGGSYGQPEVVCTSAQNVSDCPDGGPQAGRCRTYTMCESVGLS